MYYVSIWEQYLSGYVFVFYIIFYVYVLCLCFLYHLVIERYPSEKPRPFPLYRYRCLVHVHHLPVKAPLILRHKIYPYFLSWCRQFCEHNFCVSLSEYSTLTTLFACLPISILVLFLFEMLFSLDTSWLLTGDSSTELLQLSIELLEARLRGRRL